MTHRQQSTVNKHSGATGIDINRRAKSLYQGTHFDDQHKMSWVVKQTGNVLRRAVQFFQGDSENYFDYAPAIQGVAIALYIK